MRPGNWKQTPNAKNGFGRCSRLLAGWNRYARPVSEIPAAMLVDTPAAWTAVCSAVPQFTGVVESMLAWPSARSQMTSQPSYCGWTKSCTT